MELSSCRLCPRKCGVDRLRGQRGYCAAGDCPVVYRHGLHEGEEPPISGHRGSGTVFFSHCTLRCRYCQNYPWSQEHQGRVVDVPALSELFRGLQRQGAHNWNLVSPTPWWPWIDEALKRVKNDGIRLPIVYNTSGFESIATLERFAGQFDIALTDLRYASADTAHAGSDCPEYVTHARQALRWFCDRLPPLALDPADGTARRGVICRLLVLPGHAAEAKESLRWLREQIGTAISVSLMAQYTPLYRATEAPWNRRVRLDEYDGVRDELEQLGFENGWIQAWGDTPPDTLLGCRMAADTQAPENNERTHSR